MYKTRTWVVWIAAAAMLLTVIVLRLATKKEDSRIVQVIQDGTVLREIDLSDVGEEYSFVVEDGEGGSNTVLVQPGRICISEADCPDHICVQQGWLSDEPYPIVCLPHRLVIMLQSPSAPGADAAAG